MLRITKKTNGQVVFKASGLLTAGKRVGDGGANCGSKPLPGVAQVALQQGKYAGKLIHTRIAGGPTPKPFKYSDKGSMAVVGGRAPAVPSKVPSPRERVLGLYHTSKRIASDRKPSRIR